MLKVSIFLGIPSLSGSFLQTFLISPVLLHNSLSYVSDTGKAVFIDHDAAYRINVINNYKVVSVNVRTGATENDGADDDILIRWVTACCKYNVIQTAVDCGSDLR